MITTSIVWDHRGRVKNGEAGPLEVRVTVDRKPYYIATGVKVRKREWQFGCIVDRPDSPELNERLAIIVKRVEAEVNECLRDGRQVNVAEVRRKVNELIDDQNDAPMLDWCDAQVEDINVSEGTRKHYRTVIRRLREFGRVKKWQDATVENILAFDAWLRKRRKEATKAEEQAGIVPDFLSEACVYNHHKCVKKLLYLAEKLGKLDRSPYGRLKGEFGRGESDNLEYLDAGERKKLLDFMPGEGTRLQVARDLFVVQMFTGLAYADMQKLKMADYKKVKGKWVRSGDRTKTGAMFISQLLPPVVEVLERYGGVMPKMVNQEYNRVLKTVGSMLGIETKLHSHLGRHTFATMMLENGVKVENLQRMLGHVRITQTMRYAKVMAESVHADFDMVAERLK